MHDLVTANASIRDSLAETVDADGLKRDAVGHPMASPS